MKYRFPEQEKPSPEPMLEEKSEREERQATEEMNIKWREEFTIMEQKATAKKEKLTLRQ